MTQQLKTIKQNIYSQAKRWTLLSALFGFSSLMQEAIQAENLTLTSQAVQANGRLSESQVFKGFGCEGKNISPDLSWSGAPKDTKSFAITVYDPDAPTGSGWWHWVVYNLPAQTQSLAQGAGDVQTPRLPEGSKQGRTDFGSHGFGGACPPKGDKPHRYIFTVYALKTDKIDLPTDASSAMIGFMIKANTLAEASITANYSR